LRDSRRGLLQFFGLCSIKKGGEPGGSSPSVTVRPRPFRFAFHRLAS
jgi:hypothetical protein